MQHPCNAFGLLSKKQYAPKAEIRFMIKLLTDPCPEIMAYGYHRGINECYAGTSSESPQIKEEHELEEYAAFQLHKAVVRHSFRKIRLHRILNKEQVVVLEIAECTEMEIQQNRHDFTV